MTQTLNGNSEYDHTAAIHYADLAKSGPSNYGNDTLKSEVAMLGVGLVAIPNGEAYDLDAGTVHAVETGVGDTIALGAPLELPLGNGGVEVIRARLATPRQLEEKLDVVNGPKLRSIGASKWQQYELAREFMPATVLVTPDRPLTSDITEGLVGDKLVVKADTSQQSKYMEIVPRSEVLATIAGMREDLDQKAATLGKEINKNVIVQEFVPGSAWANLGLRPLDEANADLLTKDGTNVELRMYCFVDAAGNVKQDTRFHATLGVVDGPKGWVAYVDQASIPAEAYDIAETVSSRLLDKAGVRGGFFTIDLIHGPQRPDGTGGIYIREINTRDPMMTEAYRHEPEARTQRKKLATLMATIANHA